MEKKDTYQLDRNSLVRNEISSQVDSAMSSFAQDVKQLVPFTQDSGNLA